MEQIAINLFIIGSLGMFAFLAVDFYLMDRRHKAWVKAYDLKKDRDTRKNTNTGEE